MAIVYIHNINILTPESEDVSMSGIKTMALLLALLLAVPLSFEDFSLLFGRPGVLPRQ